MYSIGLVIEIAEKKYNRGFQFFDQVSAKSSLFQLPDK